ncbi:MAG: hypothetical protein GF335_03350 [Candidatus Moranbacteria bacterium]|nr:hypothetical protein [Candidatus Moranbacteria bacterium]
MKTFLIILILILIAAGGFVLFRSYKQKNNFQAAQKTDSPTVKDDRINEKNNSAPSMNPEQESQELSNVNSDNQNQDSKNLLEKIQALEIVLKNKTLFKELPLQYNKIKGLKKIKLMDENQNPIKTKVALNQENIDFPSMIITDNLEFLIYKGPEDPAPSHAILIKNNNDANKNLEIMKNWEPSMIKDLKSFILIGEKYDTVEIIENPQFKDSSFSENTRYFNFTNDNAISLTYTVKDDYIIIFNSLSIQEVLKEHLKNL